MFEGKGVMMKRISHGDPNRGRIDMRSGIGGELNWVNVLK